METTTILDPKISFYKTKFAPTCPNCKSHLHNRVSRGWIVKNVFFWLSVKRYRCDKCFKSVYVKSLAA